MTLTELIPTLRQWSTAALSWWGTFPLLLILLLVFFSRQYIISYGIRHRIWSSMGLLVILASILPSLGWLLANKIILITFLVVTISELHLSTIGKEHHPSNSFNAGIIIAFLTTIHPGFLLLYLVEIIRLRHQQQFTHRHLSALLLSWLSVTSIGIFWAAPATPQGIHSFFQERYAPLLEVSLPKTEILPLSTALILLLITLVWALSKSYNTLLHRHRRFLTSQVSLAIALALLYLLYQKLYFGFTSYFYTLLLFQYFLTLIHSKRRQRFLLLITYLTALTLVGLHWHVGIPN